jgi:regulator of protease activity HflC (stomatin/prohibitin superfamily)
MQRAMAKQAEAERERRAKIIAAEGELQASHQLAEAAAKIATAPGAMTLRYLQTLAEIAVENNSTTIFPVPIDLLQGLGRAFNTNGSVTHDGETAASAPARLSE